MNNFLSLFGLSDQYLAILPVLLLMGLGVLTLLWSLTPWRTSPVAVYAVLWAQFGILVFSLAHICQLPHPLPGPVLGGMLYAGVGPQLAGVALQAMALVVGWMSKRHSQKVGRLSLEYYGVLISATVAASLMCQAAHLAMFFVALEASSLFVTLLLALSAPQSPRNALKYLIQSGLSGVIVLWGIALIYLHTGSLGYGALFSHLASGASPWALAGAALVSAGLLFKLGLFPFTFYLPGIYQQAALPVVAYIATVSKFAAAFALWVLLAQPFYALHGQLWAVVGWMAGASLVWAALSALHQTDLRRLLALSGVVHAGFVTVAVFLSQGQPAALPVAFFYFLAYIPAAILFLYALIELNLPSPSLSDLRGMHQRHPGLAMAMCLAVASMAGLPPLAGFIAKFMVLWQTMQAAQWAILAAMVAASVIGLYYYLAIIWALVGRHSDQPESPASARQLGAPISTSVFICLCVAMILALGVFQGQLSGFMR